VIATAAAALVLAGCGSSSDSGAASSTSVATSTSAAAQTGALRTADSALGPIVVDAQGRTVYYFDKDTAGSGKSACSGQCLANWPAVAADSSSPQVSSDVTGQVGTITRDDGTLQLTLNGFPLYLFAGDHAAGDINGQAKQGVWWVIAPDGTKVTASMAPTGAATPGY
jgi:predicted lipoprotein with Yx(FWY)xxD motif